MKIGIYNEPAGDPVGGSEYLVALLAGGLARSHEVELLHHRTTLTKKRLAEHSAADLSAVAVRYVAPESKTRKQSRNPCRRLDDARTWHASLSQPYELFINSTHGVPPFCHARWGVLLVLFPLFKRPDVWPRTNDSANSGLQIRRVLRRCYDDWEWNKRFRTYQMKLAISHYTQTWTKRWWGIDCDVLYPPVDTDSRIVEKSNTILSVGRFTAAGVLKKHLEMLTAFRQLEPTLPEKWEYLSVGALGNTPADQDYFENLHQLAMGGRVRLLAELPRPEVKAIFEQARIFWHATGYGEDDAKRPELAEHFGIATVEAMGAGCVPVVINKGAQPEIVQHGVSGFLWETLDELKEYTLRLVRDEPLRLKMADAARERARFFSRKKFVERFESLLAALVS